MDCPNAPDLVQRIQMEFVEMPGLKLTLSQAGRLWNLPVEHCAMIFSDLVAKGFLARTAHGEFLRRGSETVQASA
jgi:hypothetical protein